MRTILSYNKMQDIKPCSQNNKALIETLIGEVEFGKLQKIVGTETYNAIVAEINGETVSDELKEILDEGLYKCIAYLVYARYIQESMIVDTFTGMVAKNRQDSSTASTGALKNMANEYSDMAMLSFSLVKEKIEKKYACIKNEALNVNKFSEIKGIRRKTGSCEQKRKNIIYL